MTIFYLAEGVTLQLNSQLVAPVGPCNLLAVHWLLSNVLSL